MGVSSPGSILKPIVTRAFKILPMSLWANVGETVPLVPVDIKDGYMHMSTADTVEETARKHFSGQTDLVILEIDLTKVPGLKWEEARGGKPFPPCLRPRASFSGGLWRTAYRNERRVRIPVLGAQHYLSSLGTV